MASANGTIKPPGSVRDTFRWCLDYGFNPLPGWYKTKATCHDGDRVYQQRARVELLDEWFPRDQSRNLGVESFGELDIWKLIEGNAAKMKISVFTNFSFIDARYVNSKVSAYENKKVEFVPPVIFRSGISFRKSGFSATVQYAYTARQFGDATDASTPSNNGINGPIPSYYVMDLSADYIFSKKFLFSASINNLSNHMYYTRRADSYPGPGIIPADGRSFYLTVQVKI